jgi:hypothetical protein
VQKKEVRVFVATLEQLTYNLSILVCNARSKSNTGNTGNNNPNNNNPNNNNNNNNSARMNRSVSIASYLFLLLTI